MEALNVQRKLQEEYEKFENEQKTIRSELNREEIIRLSADIPKLWSDPLTATQEKKKIVRLLLKQVVVNVKSTTEKVNLQLIWFGNCVTEHELTRPVAKYQQLSYYLPLLDRIEELSAQKLWPSKIAAQLNKEGWRPPKRRETFCAEQVASLLSKRLKVNYRPRYKKKLKKGEWWLIDLSREIGIPEPTLYSWIRRGWIAARQPEGREGYWILWADKNEIERLKKLHTRKRSWSNELPPAELITPNKRY
ncbi:MAG: hypothetical protein HQK53_04930 [Oligoflexia bacterium]|nr:hypothetical protein [Oligoflexia bacterium]